MRVLRQLYLHDRLFYVLGLLAVLFALGFTATWFHYLAQVVALAVVIAFVTDLSLLYNIRIPVKAERTVAPVSSLHDENKVFLRFINRTTLRLYVRVIEELPVQLQERDHTMHLSLEGNARTLLTYYFRPFQRGEYLFRNTNLYIRTRIGLAERRIIQEAETHTKVYPSILQMKKFELYTIQRIARFEGVKKMRRIGHSYEFEQIKQYVQGDDVRAINWKATGRTGMLMVNHYEDEKAQQVYCLIDKSRVMKMPFDQLTLMDYAINSSLVISNIAIRKQDKAGLITFSDKPETIVQADRHAGHLRKILEALYREQEQFSESGYDRLYHVIRKVVRVRSLLFLYTNFESYYALERVLPVLRRLNKLHLLVVVFFENEEIRDFGQQAAANSEEIFLTTFAAKFTLDKKQIMQELTKYGIQTIVTTPRELTINTINKYLELKSRGLI
jgi:uncharacterized protein (DUF58 family)